jgi:hypothetical protein
MVGSSGVSGGTTNIVRTVLPNWLVLATVVVAMTCAAGQANATCASISGMSTGSGCTSTLTSFAFGVGPGAAANSAGFLNTAVAVGKGANAESWGILNNAIAIGPMTMTTTQGLLTSAAALGSGATAESRYVLNTASALGKGSTARTFGGGNAAVALGSDSTAKSGTTALDGGNLAITLGNDAVAETGGVFASHGYGNIALNVSRGGDVVARGVRNTAVSIGGTEPWPNNVARAFGVGNRAVNIGGNGNIVYSQGGTDLLRPGLHTALNAGGSDNTVKAGQFGKFRPFAVAAAIGGHAKTANQTTTGIKIK